MSRKQNQNQNHNNTIMSNQTLNDTLFASLKSHLAKAASQSSYKDVLKMEVGKTYEGRLLLNPKEPEKSSYTLVSFSFQSNATGENIFFNSPASVGGRCPAKELQRRLYAGSPAEQALAKKLQKKESRLWRFYVTKADGNPEVEGKVKVLKANKPLQAKIQTAIDDERRAGKRIFDLGPDGRTFIIKVTKKGDYWNYDTSEFDIPDAIPGMTEAKITEIYNTEIDLASINKIHSFEEIENILNTHWYVNGAGVPAAPKAAAAPQKTESAPAAAAPVKKEAPKTKDVSVAEEDVDDLLTELGL